MSSGAADYKYDFENHIHRVNGLIKNDKEYYINITETSGTGVVYCHEPIVTAAIKAQNHFDHNKDYYVDIIPVVTVTDPAVRVYPQDIMWEFGQPTAIQVGAGFQQIQGVHLHRVEFPPDMNPDGCDVLQSRPMKLRMSVDKVMVTYSEPVVDALRMCGSIGVYQDPTDEQRHQISNYLDTLGSMGSLQMSQNPVGVIQTAIQTGHVTPTFSQFRVSLDIEFPRGSKGVEGIIRSAGLNITPASWNDKTWEIPIMLDHLYNNKYVHNGINDPSEIQELADLLGGMSKATAHVIHTLLHTYDAMYMHRKTDKNWKYEYEYLTHIMGMFIPDNTTRRCYFRMLNKRATEFLVRDALDPYAFRYPYTIAPDAVPDKARQYKRYAAEGSSSLIASFNTQLYTGQPVPQSGTTTKIPNT